MLKGAAIDELPGKNPRLATTIGRDSAAATSIRERPARARKVGPLFMMFPLMGSRPPAALMVAAAID
jgi:hypothetical protein